MISHQLSGTKTVAVHTFLFQLANAFPSWAGAILFLYSFLVGGSAAVKGLIKGVSRSGLGE